MKTSIKNPSFPFVLSLSLALLLTGPVTAQTFATLHNFTAGYAGFAQYPYGGVVLLGETFYGTAFEGGDSGEGSVYKVKADGSGFAILYNFTATQGTNFTNSHGALPVAGLVLSGNTLYGTTLEGGAAGDGSVFAINTDGTGFTNLHSFTAISANTNVDGANPFSGLALSGSTLYGTAQNGGRFGLGTVFKINTDGTGLTTLFSFEGGSTGEYPVSGVIVSGPLLYGTTEAGGNFANGSVFSLSTGGNIFNSVYSFTGGNDGATPVGGVILSNNTFYGTTSAGGSLGYGTVFSVQTDGMGISNLYTFSGGDDGGNPAAGVILSGGTLYGTTTNGGSGNGVVFAVDIGATNSQTLYTFTGGSDGTDPYAGLVLFGGTLYGTAVNGYTPDNATLYAVVPQTSSFSPVNAYTGGSDGNLPLASLFASGNALYGTASGGGFELGTLYSMNTDGTDYTNLYTFADFGEGAYPEGPMLLSGSLLYGTTVSGGSGDYGTVFAISNNGTGLTPLHSFDLTDGSAPSGALLLSSNTLFGVTANGGTTTNGAAAYGTVYRVGTGGQNFTNLHTFPMPSLSGNTHVNSDGDYPQGGLVLAGNTLFGAAGQGGVSGAGAIYAVTINGTGFTNMRNFTATDFYTQTNTDGALPQGGLVLIGGTLYGTTAAGGTAASGTIFAISTNGSDFTNLFNFPGGSSSASPTGGMLLIGNTLYGMTTGGGAFNNGTIFSIQTNGSSFTVLYSFSAYEDLSSENDDGSTPMAGLILSGNTLYGTANQGGYWGGGTVFGLALSSVFSRPELSIIRAGSNVILTWPATATGFTLQSTTNLFPAAWSGVSPAPVIYNGQYTVTNPISGAPRFYELVQ